jgi:hypothetical protein
MALVNECLIALITGIRALTTVYALMCYKIALLTECLITYFTCIWALTTMYPLMPYKMTLSIECLITPRTQILMLNPITRIYAFSTVHLKVFIESALEKTQRLITGIYPDRKTN